MPPVWVMTPSGCRLLYSTANPTSGELEVQYALLTVGQIGREVNGVRLASGRWCCGRLGVVEFATSYLISRRGISDSLDFFARNAWQKPVTLAQLGDTSWEKAL